MLRPERVYQINYLGEIASQSEAKGLLKQPGDFILIRRKVLRSIILRCPCSCGDDLVINLDSRIGKAWVVYLKKKRVTIFPSIWRDNRCESHFIIWNDKIYWCDYDSLWDEDREDAVLSESILRLLEKRIEFIHYKDIADSLNEIPWAVLDSCRILAKKGLIVEAQGGEKGSFIFKA